jgi:hypothetical protein
MSTECKRDVEKFGWRISEWGPAVGISRARVFELIQQGNIESVKDGAARIITTHPRDYLSTLANR